MSGGEEDNPHHQSRNLSLILTSTLVIALGLVGCLACRGWCWSCCYLCRRKDPCNNTNRYTVEEEQGIHLQTLGKNYNVPSYDAPGESVVNSSSAVAQSGLTSNSSVQIQLSSNTAEKIVTPKRVALSDEDNEKYVARHCETFAPPSSSSDLRGVASSIYLDVASFDGEPLCKSSRHSSQELNMSQIEEITRNLLDEKNSESSQAKTLPSSENEYSSVISTHHMTNKPLFRPKVDRVCLFTKNKNRHHSNLGRNYKSDGNLHVSSSNNYQSESSQKFKFVDDNLNIAEEEEEVEHFHTPFSSATHLAEARFKENFSRQKQKKQNFDYDDLPNEHRPILPPKKRSLLKCAKSQDILLTEPDPIQIQLHRQIMSISIGQLLPDCFTEEKVSQELHSASSFIKNVDLSDGSNTTYNPPQIKVLLDSSENEFMDYDDPIHHSFAAAKSRQQF